MTEVCALIESLQLEPHPEGGYYRETWRAASAPGTRAIGTAIYFLLDAGQRSHWHRVDATELWMWHAGDPLLLSTSPTNDGPIIETTLGADVLANQTAQHVIAAHHWQAAHASQGWALVSCVVVPGFEFAGFELAAPGWQPELRK